MARRRNRRQVGYVERGLSLAELIRRANRIADAQINPQVRGVRNQGRLGAEAITGATQALLDRLNATAPGVQAGFADAASALGRLGAGFSDEFRAGGGPTGAGDVLYGTGAALPSGSLASEGARLGAAALGRSQAAGRQGLQDVSSLQFKTQDAVSELLRQVPGLRRQALQDLLAFEAQKRGLALNAGALNLDRAELRENRRQFNQSLAQRERESLRDVWLRRNEATMEESGKTWEASQEAWFDARTAAGKMADDLFNRTKDVPAGPTSEGGKRPNRPKYQRAFSILMNRYGRELVSRYGFPQHRVNRMLHAMLKSAGFQRPRRRKGGGVTGAAAGAAGGS